MILRSKVDFNRINKLLDGVHTIYLAIQSFSLVTPSCISVRGLFVLISGSESCFTRLGAYYHPSGLEKF